MAFLSNPLGGAEGEQESFKVDLQLTDGCLQPLMSQAGTLYYTVHQHGSCLTFSVLHHVCAISV